MIERFYGLKGRARGGLGQAARAAATLAPLAGLVACGHQGFVGQTETYFYGLRNGGEDLYHNMEGGVIAEQRPPPPGDNDPYPNLGAIPARPAPPDIANEQRIADQLAAQRDAAERAAAANPLVPRPAPPPTPKPAAPDPNANKVVVDAAPTPPAKPDATPAPAATQAASAIPAIADVPAVPASVTAGPLPSLAAAPPPAPTGLGGLPTNPAPVAVAQPAQPALPAASSNTIVVDFTYGSDTLPPSANLNLRRFALAHKGAAVTVTGHGGDVLPGADAQSRALDLALRRARAMAESLNTAGIPAANLHLRAEAAGRGGVASL
jgi:outer membrane protein OmpA-like peptidoglycan-associated protein